MLGKIFNPYKFSIIIAVYNTGEFLEEAIESIINQSIGFEDVELILVDDGSEDNSKDICLKYQKAYPDNIRYIYQENQGQATARNNGMQVAHGKYLNFLDSDDKLELNALELVYDFFENNYKNVDVVSIPMKFFDRQSGEHILNYKYESTRLVDLTEEPDHIQLSASAAFIKRKAVKNHKFDTELVVSEDAIFVNKILLEKCTHGVISDTSYLYRKRLSKTSTIDSSLKNKDYYIHRSKAFFKALFDYSNEKYGVVQDFIKYTVMYDIQWMFDISDVSDVLNENELNELYSTLHELLSEIDDHIILNQKHWDRSLLKSILAFKHGKIDTVKNIRLSNAVKLVNDIIIDRLNYHVFYIDNVEVDNDTLHILGFLKSFFNSDELKIHAVKYSKTDFMNYFVNYFNNNKLAFIKKDFLNDDGENLQEYLLNSNDYYSNLKISNYLNSEPDFDLNHYYRIDEIRDLINNDLIDGDNYNKAYDNLTGIFIENNGEFYEADYVEYPYRERYYLNLNYNKSYNFECKIPLKVKEDSFVKIKVSFEELDFYLDIGFNYYSKLNIESFYSKKENYLVNFENNMFNVKAYTYNDILELENENIDYLTSLEDSDLNEVISFRKLYYDSFNNYTHKRIWLFMDRPDVAGDNAEHLYRYSNNQLDGIEKYFVLSGESSDYNRLKNEFNLVEYGSNEHKLLSCFAEKIITSHPDDDIINPFSGRFEKYYNGLFSAKICFLQHGIILNNISSWLHKYDKYLHLFVTSAKKEYDSLFNHPYNYEESTVQLLGLPRYDGLKEGLSKNQIVIMPSWRRSIRVMSDDEIIESEYFKRWNSLLNNNDLIEFAKKHDYEIVFKPHINIYDCIDLFDLDNVKFDKSLSYQDVFNESKLLITDYSSVTFDFAYLKKPLIYYQWDNDDFHFNIDESYFDYSTMGFGEVVKSEDELVSLIKQHITDDCVMNNKFKKRVDEFYEFNDKNNSKRVYEYILSMKK